MKIERDWIKKTANLSFETGKKIELTEAETEEFDERIEEIKDEECRFCWRY